MCVVLWVNTCQAVHSPGCQVPEVGKDLFAQFVHKLIEAQVHLRLHLIIEKPLLEVVQSIMAAVTVQVQWVEDVPGGEG